MGKSHSKSVSLEGRGEPGAQEVQTSSTPVPPKSSNPYALSVWYQPKDETATEFDIVFIHGLTGNSTNTWKATGAQQPWPATKLAKTFPRARIMTFGYDADVVRPLARVGQSTLLDHGSNLMGYLRDKRSGTAAEARPLMFVAHSLGGLVCEQTLVLAEQHPKNDVKQIWRSTFGIIFMGTPQLGADLAVVAGRLARVISLLDPTRKVNRNLLTTLRRDSSDLATMQNSFKALVANRSAQRGSLAVQSFAEELPVPLLGQVVVSTQSCRFPAGFDDYGIIHADHMGMTKIQETDDAAYDAFTQVIRRWLRTEIPDPIVIDWRLGTKTFYRYPKPVEHFRPRDSLLRDLADAMMTAQTVVLHGLGGTGKTQLAWEYCRQCEINKTVWAIFVAKASSRATMETSFDELWDYIRPSSTTGGPTTLSMAAKIQLVKDTMARWPEPWLLVFDNYNDLDGFPGILEFVPRSKHGRVLFTSRLRGLTEYGFNREISVDGLDEETALDMLLGRAKMPVADLATRSSAKAAVNRLARLPLAIEQAAAYLLATGDSLDDFTRKFALNRAEVLNTLSTDLSYRSSTPEGRESRLNICTTWELSFQMIRDEVPRTQQIKGYVLTLMAYLDARSISDRVFEAPFTTLGTTDGDSILVDSPVGLLQSSAILKGTAWNMNALYLLMGEFTTLSLMHQIRPLEDSKHRTLSLHPLVQDWLKIRGKPRDRRRSIFLAACLLGGCVAAHARASEGQQMSLSSDMEIQTLQHLDALDEELQLELSNDPPIHFFASLQSVVQQMAQTMTDIRATQLRQLMRDAGQWLSVSHPADYHRSILDSAASGTASSILDDDRFAEWTSDSWPSPILHVVGRVGSGKTFATAVVVSYLQDVMLKAHQRSSVLYFYVQDAANLSRIARELFGSLLKLLLASEPSEIFEGETVAVRKLYAAVRDGKQNVQELPEILSILHEAVKKLHRCYIVLDGLHILPRETLHNILSRLRVFLTLSFVKLMVTTRGNLLDDLEEEFPVQRIFFSPEDTVLSEKLGYVHDQISTWTMTQSLKDQIETFILGRSTSSFLYIRLLLDEMESVASEEDLQQKIHHLPLSLDGFLEDRLSYMLRADPVVRKHALLMICWVVCALAPVSLTALLPVFFPDLGHRELAAAAAYFQGITGDLVIVDGTLGVPRFAHSSIKEYLQASLAGQAWSSYRGALGGRWQSTRRFISQPGPRTGLRDLPYDHAFIALECLRQLATPRLDFGPVGPSLKQAQTLVFERDFLKYAAVYWGLHVRQYHIDHEGDDADDGGPRQLLTARVVSFLTCPANLQTWRAITRYVRAADDATTTHVLSSTIPPSTPLAVARAFNLSKEIINALILAPRGDA